jgi:hypothetical protein
MVEENNMRLFIISVIVILLVLGVAGIAGGSALAKTGPFLPGSPFFPIQNIAEQAQARLQSPAEQQTQIYFSLVERRLDNLVALTGTPREIDNLQYLNEAIDQAILSWSSLPASSADSMRERFIYLILLSDIVINSLEVAPTHNPELVGSLLAKLATLQKLAEDPSASPILMAS